MTIDDGVRGDPTMRLFHQLLRVDLVKAEPIKAQILFTRVHRKNPKLSENVGYISYSNQGDLFDLARHFFASGIALMLARSMPFFSSGVVDVKHAVRKNLLTQIEVIVELTELYMKGLK